MVTTFISEAMWLFVIAGWLVLLGIGLEADKPLSGGIPGHRHDEDDHPVHKAHIGDWLGEQGSWALFISVALLLPVLLGWIFAFHPR